MMKLGNIKAHDDPTHGVWCSEFRENCAAEYVELILHFVLERSCLITNHAEHITTINKLSPQFFRPIQVEYLHQFIHLLFQA